MSEMRRVEIVVTGRVQGVFYRDSTRRTAGGLGLTGIVRNLPVGDVEIIAEGSEDSLEALVRWCRQGPPAAVVKDAAVTWRGATGEFKGFQIRY